MEAAKNPDAEGDIGSNDGEVGMPELKASTEPDLNEEEEISDEDGEEEEEEVVVEEDVGDDEEDVVEEVEVENPEGEIIEEEEDDEEAGQEEPDLIQQAEVEDVKVEEEEDDELEAGEEEEEDVEGEEVDEELAEEEEEDIEMETEEGLEEEDYENTGNPGAVHESADDSHEEQGDDSKTDDLTKGPSQFKEGSTTIMTRKRSASISSSEDGPKRKQGRNVPAGVGSEQQKDATDIDGVHDRYCWVCHKDGVYFNCKICPRSYHMRCICLPEYPEPTLPEGEESSKVCICPECVVVMNAEEVDKRSEAMKQLSMDQLISLLKQICGRMKLTPGADPFMKPVQPSDACDYFEYIVYPMDIQTLEKNIKQRQYGSTEAFLADAQWIVHNSIIFNSSSSPYTASAKRILKVCKQELTEIETCPECYTNAHTKSDTWFVEACRRPHMLVWAKLKGFPFWPAKAMKIKDDQVDVRFFGQHDRAWVNLKDCFLYSEEMPAAPPKKNTALLSAIDELNTHVARLAEAHGEVELAKVKTPLGRELSNSEIRRLLPDFTPEEVVAKKVVPSNGDKEKALLKSSMTITISSIKTNPTIVNNSLSEQQSPTATEKKMNIKPKRGSAPETGTTTTPSRATRSNATTNSSAEPEEPAAVVPETTAEESNDTKATAEPEDPKPEETAKEEAEEEEEKPEKEKPKKEEVDDDFESRVPSGEILASALGLKRITRKPSQSDSAPGSSPSAKPDSDKVLSMVSSNSILAESRSSRTSKSISNEDEPGLNSILPQHLKKRISVTQVEAPPVDIQIKTEPLDPVENDDLEDMDQDELEEKPDVPVVRSKAQDFMEHISTQAQTNPGYRFNISKDISISAIGKGQDNDQNDSSSLGSGSKKKVIGQGVTVNHAGSVQRPSLSVQPSKQGIGGSQIQGSLVRPKLSQALQQPVQAQTVTRFLQYNKDVKSLTRMLKPAMSQTTTKTLVSAGANAKSNRAVPGAIQMSALRGGTSILQKLAKEGTFKQQPIVVDSTSLRVDSVNQYSINTGNPLQKVASSLQANQQSVQGAITLPGGTITVTPLSLQGGNSSNSSYSSNISINGERSLKVGGGKGNVNGLPISIVESNNSSPAVTATPVMKSKSNAQSNRKVTNMVPPSVVATVQNLQKNVNELIRMAAEAIAVDMVEHTTGKNEKSETEKIQQQHRKEVTDLRLNHELMMRELRSNMDSEKKRAVAELRRQMEMDKQKAIEEAKKKQWCAQCLREALFYCCWNTSYCGYNCQEEHWPTHMSTCTQNSTGGSGSMGSAASLR